jgi:DNA repair exonuclease SbcCD ATPase subunit
LAIKQKAAKLEGSQESTLQGLDRAKAKVDAQEKRAASVKPIEDFRRILDKVNTILMKDGLPRLLSLQYMQKLNERLAFYLRTINADFSAFIDENLEFMARKSDGLVHHAKRLSGGQKQQASVCYLLAVNDVFASTLGVLALDEPSGAMQESNSRDLAEAFNYLAKMGQQTGRQFIVITHSNALAALGCKNISLEGHE